MTTQEVIECLKGIQEVEKREGIECKISVQMFNSGHSEKARSRHSKPWPQYEDLGGRIIDIHIDLPNFRGRSIAE